MKAEKGWDHDAFFAYMDRWMYEDDAEFVKMIKTALGVDYEGKPWCLGMHAFPGDEKFTDEMWAQYRQSAGMTPVAEFRKTIDEQGQVKIGTNREFIVNGKKVFPLMLLAQAKPKIQNAWALGGELVEGKCSSRTLFSSGYSGSGSIGLRRQYRIRERRRGREHLGVSLWAGISQENH